MADETKVKERDTDKDFAKVRAAHAKRAEAIHAGDRKVEAEIAGLSLRAEGGHLFVGDVELDVNDVIALQRFVASTLAGGTVI